MPIVIIDPGHGGTDPGALGNGLREKDLTLSVSRLISQQLAARYHTDVRLTRSTDKTMTLGERTRLANEAKADCFISVHINSATNDKANGFESFVFSGTTIGSKTGKLQQAIHKRTGKLWTQRGGTDRGMKQANFHVLRETRCPAVLVELGFIINKRDAEWLRDAQFLQQNATAIADGIAEAMKLSGKEPEALADGVYRVLVDGTQIGAYAEAGNVTAQVAKAIGAGKQRIELVRI